MATHTGQPSRPPRASSSGSCSSQARRLARPVRSSVRATTSSRSSRSARSIATAASAASSIISDGSRSGSAASGRPQATTRTPTERPSRTTGWKRLERAPASSSSADTRLPPAASGTKMGCDEEKARTSPEAGPSKGRAVSNSTFGTDPNDAVGWSARPSGSDS